MKELDIDRLHEVFFGESEFKRRSGNTTLLVTLIIGTAQVFDPYKEFIVTSETVARIQELKKVIMEVGECMDVQVMNFNTHMVIDMVNVYFYSEKGGNYPISRDIYFTSWDDYKTLNS